MENIERTTGRIERAKVYNLILLIFILITAAFIYLFINNTHFKKLVSVPFVETPPAFVQMIYGDFGEGQLNKPMDVAVSGDRVFVSDTNNHRVQVFNKEGDTLFRFGERGIEPGQFEFPYGISVDETGHIYVADFYNGNISVFDRDGKFIEYFGKKTGDEKYLLSPGGLRIREDKLYVTDIQGGKVLVYSLEGKLIKEFGQEEALKFPNAITVDNNGTLYVVDTGNQKVVVYDKDYKVIGQMGGLVGTEGQFILTNPRGVGVNSRGDIFVVSNLNHTIHVFDKNTKKWSFGGMGNTVNQFLLPNGMFIDEENFIYITDTVNNRVAVYR